MDVNSVLKTLRRVDDRIILATMGRDLDLLFGQSCLCGWFVREKLAEIRNVGASKVDITGINPETGGFFVSSALQCARHFGGTDSEWRDIWSIGDQSDMRSKPEVVALAEEAFVRRVDEAVNPKRKSRKAAS